MKRKIYNLNNGVIEVYGFLPVNYKLQLFRLEELKEIPMKRQILRMDKPRSWFTRSDRIVYECGAYTLREFDYSKMSQADKASLVRKLYINGSYHDDPVKVVDDLILLSPRQDFTDYRVQLTEDAYCGYLLDNEQFDNPILGDHSLDRLRGLFQITDEPLSSISLKELEKAYDMDLVDGNFDEALDSLEKTSKVYKKIR